MLANAKLPKRLADRLDLLREDEEVRERFERSVYDANRERMGRRPAPPPKPPPPELTPRQKLRQAAQGFGGVVARATAAAHAVNRHKLRIRNITNGSTAIIGISHYASRSGSLDNSDNDASLTGILEINATATYELQHYCEGSENVGDRLGVATSSGENEIYSTLTIQPIL